MEYPEETAGTRLARQIREKLNALTPEEREYAVKGFRKRMAEIQAEEYDFWNRVFAARITLQ